jgi:UDP-glucose 4-epimerase
VKKVLVIGASGSLGQGVIEEIKGQFKLTGTYRSRAFESEGVDIRQLDVCDNDSFGNLDDDYDAVFLVAGAMPAMMSGYCPQDYIDVNVTGTLNVLEFCRRNRIKKLIYVMTFSDAAGSFYTGIPIADDGPRSLNLIGDHAVYSISKVAACDLIEHYHQEYGLQTIIFRIPTVYCKDDNFNYFVDGELREKSYIKMIRSILKRHKVEIWGNPKNSKDMPYIKDFARLVSCALKHPTAQGVFNAGTGQPVSLAELVDVLIEVFSPNQTVKKLYRAEKPSQPNFTFDMKRTNEVFDFEPSWTVKAMFQDIARAPSILEVLNREL